MFWLLEHPEANGILNIGSGKARTWNDLANSVYSAMDKIPDINYIDMPAELKAAISITRRRTWRGWNALAATFQFHSLEDGVSD